MKQAIAELWEEVAVFKGPATVKPNGMDKGTEPKPAGQRQDRGAKGSKSERLAVGEERIIKAKVPSSSCFKGDKDVLARDLVLHPHIVRIHREPWLTPDGGRADANIPIAIRGRGSAGLRH